MPASTDLSASTPDPAPSLARVARGDLCAGCGACAALAPGKIRMQLSAAGFLRPVQVAGISPAEDQAIARHCPGLGQTVVAEGRQDHVLWGPYLEMYAGHATDPALRFASSSGGALSALLTQLLESGAVDAVLQTAASDEIPIANRTVFSLEHADVLAAAGSRYAPSAPLAELTAALASGKRFAFVGKPCDVAALRSMMAEDPEIAAQIPYLLSFFCAGVPSLKGTEAVLGALGTDLDHTAAFRYRGNGWPGRATARLLDGTEKSMSYHESWGMILSHHVQHRCKICADGAGAAADVVCADAWESDADGYPLFDERDGVSLIVSRSGKGAALVRAARLDGRLRTGPFDVTGLEDIQPGQRRRRRAVLARLAGLSLFGKPIPRYRGLRLLAAARQNRLTTNARNLLGMVRRVLQGRIGANRF